MELVAAMAAVERLAPLAPVVVMAEEEQLVVVQQEAAAVAVVQRHRPERVP